MYRNNEKGFTLVELMVSVVILGILSVVTAFAYIKMMHEIRSAEAMVYIRKIHDAQVTFASAPPSLYSPSSSFCKPQNRFSKIASSTCPQGQVCNDINAKPPSGKKEYIYIYSTKRQHIFDGSCDESQHYQRYGSWEALGITDSNEVASSYNFKNELSNFIAPIAQAGWGNFVNGNGNGNGNGNNNNSNNDNNSSGSSDPDHHLNSDNNNNTGNSSSNNGNGSSPAGECSAGQNSGNSSQGCNNNNGNNGNNANNGNNNNDYASNDSGNDDPDHHLNSDNNNNTGNSSSNNGNGSSPAGECSSGQNSGNSSQGCNNNNGNNGNNGNSGNNGNNDYASNDSENNDNDQGVSDANDNDQDLNNDAEQNNNNDIVQNQPLSNNDYSIPSNPVSVEQTEEISVIRIPDPLHFSFFAAQDATVMDAYNVDHLNKTITVFAVADTDGDYADGNFTFPEIYEQDLGNPRSHGKVWTISRSIYIDAKGEVQTTGGIHHSNKGE